MKAPRPTVAWWLFATSLLATVAAMLVISTIYPTSRSGPDWSLWWGYSEAASWAGIMVAASLFGAIIVRRNRIGWLFSVGGLAGCLALLGDQFGAYALVVRDGSVPGGVPALLASQACFLAAWTLLGVVLPAAFPDGRLLSRRWRLVVWAGAIGAAAIVAGYLLTRDMSIHYAGLEATNPFGVRALAPLVDVFGLGYFLLFGATFAAVASVIVRFRRARGDERQQLKVVAYASGLAVVIGLLTANLHGVLGGEALIVRILVPLQVATVFSVPASIAVAILRYRLYDIDVIINRTLVYGALTLSLGLVYLGLVLVLQRLFGPLARESDLAVAGSTLAVAGLFRPARSRIQSFIDRRFYRHKYDAAQTVDAFSARVRQQVELGGLSDELLTVVRETMHPVHVSLWLRSS